MLVLATLTGCVFDDGGGASNEWVLCYHLTEFESTGNRDYFGHCKPSGGSPEATCLETLESVYVSGSFEGGYIATFDSEASCEAEHDRINQHYDTEGHERLPYPPERILRGGSAVPTADAGPRDPGTTEPGECNENQISLDVGEEPPRGTARVTINGCLTGLIGGATDGLYAAREGGGYCYTPLAGGPSDAGWCDRSLTFTNTVGVYWSLRDEGGTSHVGRWWPSHDGDSTAVELP